MKAHLNKDGILEITATNETEAYALGKWAEENTNKSGSGYKGLLVDWSMSKSDIDARPVNLQQPEPPSSRVKMDEFNRLVINSISTTERSAFISWADDLLLKAGKDIVIQ